VTKSQFVRIKLQRFALLDQAGKGLQAHIARLDAIKDDLSPVLGRRHDTVRAASHHHEPPEAIVRTEQDRAGRHP
jgi:hypothetical protein